MTSYILKKKLSKFSSQNIIVFYLLRAS